MGDLRELVIVNCDHKTPRVYSHSSLSCFEQCPHKYQYRYIEGLEAERRGIEAFSGSIVHLALQHLHQRADEGEVLGEEDIIAFLRDRWEENMGDDVVIVKKDMTRSDHLRRAEAGLRAYHRHYHPFDRGCTVGLEHGIKFKVQGDREHSLVGYIDRLTEAGDGVFEIHDYKTGKRLPTSADLKNDRQLALYEIGVRQNYPQVKEVRLVWHFISHDKEMTSCRTAEELTDLERCVGTLIDKIESCQCFPCRAGSLCRWCEHSDLCQH